MLCGNRLGIRCSYNGVQVKSAVCSTEKVLITIAVNINFIMFDYLSYRNTNCKACTYVFYNCFDRLLFS